MSNTMERLTDEDDSQRSLSNLDEDDSQRSWSNLIDEILTKIWQDHVDLQLQTDVRRRMRAVCTSWRASVPLTTTTPHHRVDVPNSYDHSLPEKGLYLAQNTFYLITPLANPKIVWLFRAEETEPNLFRMCNPYCGVYCLFYLFHPCFTTSKIDNLLDYQIRELHRSYTLKSSHRTHPRKRFIIDPPRVKPFRKILTSNVDGSTVFTVFALTFTGFLCFSRQGDTEWTKLMKFQDEKHKNRLIETDGNRIGNDNEFALFVDIAIYKGKFYAIEMKTGDVYLIDPLSITANTTRPFGVEIKICFSQSQTPVTRFEINRECNLSNCSLLICKGRLYYFIHVKHESNKREENNLFVLKDDTSKSQWVSVELLSEMADQVIFMLGEASFVIPQAEDLWDAGLYSRLCYVPDNLAYSDSQIQLPFRGYFKNCPNLSRDNECSSIFFPPPWLKSYYNKEGRAPVKFSKLFGSLM